VFEVIKAVNLMLASRHIPLKIPEMAGKCRQEAKSQRGCLVPI
jgi:hypothetical protein